VIVLTPGSEAFETLKSMLNHPSTRKVRIAMEGTTRATSRIMLKQNEGMWSHPIEVESERHEALDPVEPGEVTVLQFPGMPPIKGVGPAITEEPPG
jgi:hypothetical protein